MTRIDDQSGGAITNMEPGKRGMRTYFSVDDINAGAARVRELGGEAGDPMPVPNMGWFATCKDPHGNEFGLWQNDPSAQSRRPSFAPSRGAAAVVTLGEAALAMTLPRTTEGLVRRRVEVPGRPDRLRRVLPRRDADGFRVPKEERHGSSGRSPRSSSCRATRTSATTGSSSGSRRPTRGDARARGRCLGDVRAEERLRALSGVTRPLSARRGARVEGRA